MDEEKPEPSDEEVMRNLTPQQLYHVFNIINSWIILRSELTISERKAVSRAINLQSKAD